MTGPSGSRSLFFAVIIIVLGSSACVTGGGVPSVIAAGAISGFSPRYSPDGSKLVFSSDMDGNDEIYVIGTDGTGLTRLTVSVGKDLDPSFSPDGDKIIFDSDRDGPVAIFVMDADGSNQTNVSKPSQPGHIFPVWSPDGSRIAFACGSDFDRLDICVMNADGTGQHVLGGTSESREWEPSWSPDGARIAFVSNRTGDDDIYLMNSDGTGLVRLTTEPGRDADPAWSPDGSKMAFDSDRQGPGIYVMDADGSNAQRLTDGNDATPAWSPDGSRIAFYRQVGDTSSIFVMTADGTDVAAVAG